MDNQTALPVYGKENLKGRLLTSPSADGSAASPVWIQLENGRQIQLPADLLVQQSDGSYYLPFSAIELEQAQNHVAEHTTRQGQDTTLIVPVVQEELAVEKRVVETARARITKQVHEREEVVDDLLMRQEVAIEHVPINKMWDGPAPPARYEGDILVIPLLEEVLVIEKRLMLKEELHISRIQKTVREPQTVVLRSEEVTVERVEPNLHSTGEERLPEGHLASP